MDKYVLKCIETKIEKENITLEVICNTNISTDPEYTEYIQEIKYNEHYIYITTDERKIGLEETIEGLKRFEAFCSAKYIEEESMDYITEMLVQKMMLERYLMSGDDFRRNYDRRLVKKLMSKWKQESQKTKSNMSQNEALYKYIFSILDLDDLEDDLEEARYVY